jgi:competence ComEA-like helix-hairpin-helix protein
MRGKIHRWVVVLVTLLVCLSVNSVNAASPEKMQPIKGKTVNINKATEEELVKSVPLISPELAKKIVKYRKDNGNFQTLEELLQVDGFDRNLLRRIKPFLLLEGIGGKDCTC